MRFSKALTSGLILLALLAVSHGRVIQLPKQDGLDTDQNSVVDLVNHIGTPVSISSGTCRLHPDRLDCTSGPAFDVRDGDKLKRAPPRITRPGKGDEDDLQNGSGAQTGGGMQTGGDRQGGGDAPGSRPPPVANPAPAPPSVPPVHPAYADVPADFNRPGRAPGLDVLPNEIPNFRGLGTSNDDAARRASFKRFVNWDIQSSNLIQPGSHYLLFVGQPAKESRVAFKNAFNDERKHTENLDANDRGRLIDVTDVYSGIKTGDDMVPVPRHMGEDKENVWLSMLESYGIAKRTAMQGGTVRVLVDTKGDSNAINKDRLFQEGSFFHNFELGVVTGPGTKVERVLAYGVRQGQVPDPTPENPGRTKEGRIFTPPEEIWRRGEAQKGKTPDWIEGTKPENERPGFNEEENLISLD